MKATIDIAFWKKINIFSKLFLVIGMWCIHISMLLSGMDQKGDHESKNQ